MVAQIQNLLTLAFVVASMLGMGMALTPRQIIAPLRNVRNVLLALVASFVVVPAAAYLLSRVPSEPAFQIGILIVGGAAGAPFLLKLADIAEGDVAIAVALLVLLVLGTAVFLPLMLPIAVGGRVEVDAGAILQQLTLQMLLPLVVGLFARWRYPEGSAGVLPTVQAIANVSLVLLFALMMVVNLRSIIGMFGTGTIFALLAVIAIGQLAGWLLAGPSRESRVTVALGTGHRNYAAAFVVANSSFAALPNVFALIASAAAVNMVMSFALAGELRRRNGERAKRAREAGRVEAPA